MKTTTMAILLTSLLTRGETGGPLLPQAPAQEIPKVLLDPSLPEWKEKAPEEYLAKFTTSKGDFTVLVQRVWAPLGADRFYGLVKNGFYDDVRVYRVVDRFMAQFGIHGSPKVSAAWRGKTIPDDPVFQSNKIGWVSFAKGGPDTRTTQVFINFNDQNNQLDKSGFAPFGRVVDGMMTVLTLYKGYGDAPPRGNGPPQSKIQAEGNAYLAAEFKKLDFIKTARIVTK